VRGTPRDWRELTRREKRKARAHLAQAFVSSAGIPRSPRSDADGAPRPTPRGAGGVLSPRRCMGNPIGGDRGLPPRIRLRSPRPGEPRSGVHPILRGARAPFTPSEFQPKAKQLHPRPRPFLRAPSQSALFSASEARQPRNARRTLKRSCIRLAPASMRNANPSRPEQRCFDLDQRSRERTHCRAADTDRVSREAEPSAAAAS